MSSTRSIDASLRDSGNETSALIPADPSAVEHKSCCQRTASFFNYLRMHHFLWGQVAGDIARMVLGVTLLTGNAITDMTDDEPDLLDISYKSLYYAVPIAVFCALIVAYCHFEESKHFIHSDQHDHPAAAPATRSGLDTDDEEEALEEAARDHGKLTWLQSGLATMHYISDIGEDAGFFLPIVKAIFDKYLPEEDEASSLVPAYVATTAWALYTNAQSGLLNTRIAFKKRNIREEQARQEREGNRP